MRVCQTTKTIKHLKQFYVTFFAGNQRNLNRGHFFVIRASKALAGID